MHAMYALSEYAIINEIIQVFTKKIFKSWFVILAIYVG